MQMQMQVTLLLLLLCVCQPPDNAKGRTVEGSEKWAERVPFDCITVRADRPSSSHLDAKNRKEGCVESQPLSKASRSQMTAPGDQTPSAGNPASSRRVEAAADLEYPFMQQIHTEAARSRTCRTIIGLLLEATSSPAAGIAVTMNAVAPMGVMT
jgi:hypothetical protein